MKKTALIACVLLLLTGCSATEPEGGEGGDANQPTASSVATSSTRPALEVSDAATCQTLIGTDGGLVSETGQFLTDVSELSDATEVEATGLADALAGVADTSSKELYDLLTVMQEPFHDLVEAHEKGETFSLDASRFKAAGNEVIKICEPLLDEPSTTDAGAVGKVPLLNTCLALFGTDQVAVDAEKFLSEVKSLDAETAREASVLHGQLGEVALTAKPELAEPIEDIQVIFQEFIRGWEDSGDWSLDSEGYNAAVGQIKPICTVELDAADSASERGLSEGVVQPVPISGVYQEDLAAVGVVPDDFSSYVEFMKGNMCGDSPSDSSSRFNLSVQSMYDGDPAEGSGAEALRLTVAYFCPERAGALEAAIENANTSLG